MAIELKLNVHPDNTTGFTLDGVSISIRNRWSDRNLTWSIDILETSGEEIASGLKLFPEQALISTYTDLRLPPGDLVVIGSFPTDDLLKFDSLGDSMKLIYVTEAELEG